MVCPPVTVFVIPFPYAYDPVLRRLGDGGITAMITPSPPAPSSVHTTQNIVS